MTFSYVELFVSNLETSVAFYRDVLGLEVEREYIGQCETGETKVAFMVDPGKCPMVNGTLLELVEGMPDKTPLRGFLLGFNVSSLAETTRKILNVGGKQICGPYSPAEGVFISEFYGPDGEEIGIVESHEANAE